MLNTAKVAKLVSKDASPALPHDCPKCRFIGRLDGDDIYVCGDEIVVRRGWEDNDYGCWPVRMHAPPGSPYAFAQQLLIKRIRPGSSLRPNAYRS